jgi:hydroxymethylpyrimidine pyrophosphatase-like HAD family hydrolase
MVEMEEKLAESLGTRVRIEQKENGGKIHIDYFSKDDLRTILEILNKNKKGTAQTTQEHVSDIQHQSEHITEATPLHVSSNPDAAAEGSIPMDDRTPVEKKEEENEDIYSVSNFSI